MDLVASIILFVLVLILVSFIFYLRIKALQESKKILKYFENLRDKFQMQMSFHPKEGNHILPVLKGSVKGRDTLIERIVREKYKYIVISIALKNEKNITLQITPKNHLKAKEKIDETQIIKSGIAHIDKNYFLSSTSKEFLHKFLVNHFLEWEKKYATVWHLFSTLVIYGNRITLVLLSVPQKIKYDLVIEEFLRDLQEVAEQK